ncbi:MAG: dephospho-CoA kinase [Actinomycetota bacterium]
MLLVGLTGGIASGKSTVARLLVERGSVLVDADQIARDVVEPGTPAWSKVVEHFGSGILLPDKSINRVALGEIVFNDRVKLALLNEITHPEVMRRIADRLEELSSTDEIVVVDVPLLAEVGATDMFDLIVVVASGRDVQRDRLLRTRGMTEEHADARIASQLPLAERAAVADVMISNDGSMEELVAQVDELWQRLEANRGGPKDSIER